MHVSWGACPQQTHHPKCRTCVQDKAGLPEGAKLPFDTGLRGPFVKDCEDGRCHIYYKCQTCAFKTIKLGHTSTYSDVSKMYMEEVSYILLQCPYP